MVFFRKYGKIQRISPAVDTRIPESDPAFVLLANGALNRLILDHLFYQTPLRRRDRPLRRENSARLKNSPPLHRRRGGERPGLKERGSEGGCLRPAILTGRNSIKTIFLRKYSIKRRIIPSVDTRDPLPDPTSVLLANGACTGLI